MSREKDGRVAAELVVVRMGGLGDRGNKDPCPRFCLRSCRLSMQFALVSSHDSHPLLSGFGSV